MHGSGDFWRCLPCGEEAPGELSFVCREPSYGPGHEPVIENVPRWMYENPWPTDAIARASIPSSCDHSHSIPKASRIGEVNVLALYGAVLSTILAAAKIMPEWPVITLAEWSGTPDPGVIHVHILNPAKRALFIEGSFQFRPDPLRVWAVQPLDRRADIQAAFEDHLNARRPPRLCVPAGTVGELRVSGIEVDKPPRLIVLWWHRSWLLPWKLPAWVWVSDSLTSMVNRAG